MGSNLRSYPVVRAVGRSGLRSLLSFNSGLVVDK
jgi:hypothetical protein